MSLISKLQVKEKTVKVDFPDLDGFVVELAYVSRENLQKIRNRSLVHKFNKTTRQREETVDQEKFLELYCEAAIKGWSGFKVKYLPELLPADISGEDKEKEIPYSHEEAMTLLENSNIFDQFVTDTMNDLSIFSEASKAEEEKN